MPIKYTWTKEEDEFLIKNYGTLSLPKLAEKLNKSAGVVDRRAKNVHCLGYKPKANLVTDKEKEFVLANWYTMATSDIAREMGVTVSRVYSVSKALQQEGRLRKKTRRQGTVTKLLTKLRQVKKTINDINNFAEVELYDIADEVEEILEVVKERLQEGIE